jgi:23S rRNA (adenine2030-N6)-methyltransferase
MNYLHAYHAGNFADCFKHAALVALLDCLARKTTPLFVLDTHAGAGRYDLKSVAAQKTGEAAGGILRLLESRPVQLGRYIAVIDELGLYPGSPAIIRHLLREHDRLVCCELQPQTFQALRSAFRSDAMVQIHRRSGWEALGALLPPSERRGLVFIDPPFEEPDEFDTMVTAIQRSHARFAHGVYAAWYPLKRSAEVRRFYSLIQDTAIRDVLAIEMHLQAPTDAGRFDGSGIIIINPPYLFEPQACAAAAAIVEVIGSTGDGGRVESFRLADE